MVRKSILASYAVAYFISIVGYIHNITCRDQC